MRGGEKVLRALCDMYPEAIIFTHVSNPDLVKKHFPDHEIKHTFISKLPFAQKQYRSYLPLMPMALEELDLNGFDLVISSESGPTKGVVADPGARHICYCHSPMRYLWDQRHLYRREASMPVKILAPLISHPLRVWDVTSAARVDQFITNSAFVAGRIKKYYRRDSTVVHPPVDTSGFAEKVDSGLISSAFRAAVDDAYILAGQLTAYKRPDLAVDAATKLNRRLAVIGEGEASKALKKRAGPSVHFCGRVSDAEMRYAFQNCKALLFPGEEDFGIIPIEAMAAGTPVLALGRGGALETIQDGVTGCLFTDPSMEALIETIETFEANTSTFCPNKIAKHAQGFSLDVFKSNFSSAISP